MPVVLITYVSGPKIQAYSENHTLPTLASSAVGDNNKQPTSERALLGYFIDAKKPGEKYLTAVVSYAKESLNPMLTVSSDV